MAGKNRQSIKIGKARAAKRASSCINQLIAPAVAKKLSALETMDFFEVRATRADLAAFDRLMNRAGGAPPRTGDELPKGYKRRG